MGKQYFEDRERSAAIWAEWRKPGSRVKDIAKMFDINPSRVTKIVKREEARDRERDPLKWLAIDEARRRSQWAEYSD